MPKDCEKEDRPRKKETSREKKADSSCRMSHHDANIESAREAATLRNAAGLFFFSVVSSFFVWSTLVTRRRGCRTVESCLTGG